jgi:hypothetical protein
MEATSFSETSVSIGPTQCHIPEDGILHIRKVLDYSFGPDISYPEVVYGFPHPLQTNARIST